MLQSYNQQAVFFFAQDPVTFSKGWSRTTEVASDSCLHDRLILVIDARGLQEIELLLEQ